MDGTWFHIITGVLTFLSLAGTVLLILKKWQGFLFYLFANAGWAVLDFFCGIPGQAILFGVYFLLSVWGVYSWNKKEA